MKRIIGLAGAALLAIGTLTGCSGNASLEQAYKECQEPKGMSLESSDTGDAAIMYWAVDKDISGSIRDESGGTVHYMGKELQDCVIDQLGMPAETVEAIRDATSPDDKGDWDRFNIAYAPVYAQSKQTSSAPNEGGVGVRADSGNDESSGKQFVIAVGLAPHGEDMGEIVSELETVEESEERFVYETGAEYWFETDEGAVGRFQIPTEPDGDAAKVQEAARYVAERTGDSGLDDRVFIHAVIDNRNGDSEMFAGDIVGYTPEGAKVGFINMDDAATDYYLQAGSELDHGDMENVEVLNWFAEYIDNIPSPYIERGQVVSMWFVLDEGELPDEFARLTINGGVDYFDGAEAQPMDTAPSSVANIGK